MLRAARRRADRQGLRCPGAGGTPKDVRETFRRGACRRRPAAIQYEARAVVFLSWSSRMLRLASARVTNDVCGLPLNCAHIIAVCAWVCGAVMTRADWGSAIHSSFPRGSTGGPLAACVVTTVYARRRVRRAARVSRASYPARPAGPAAAVGPRVCVARWHGSHEFKYENSRVVYVSLCV